MLKLGRVRLSLSPNPFATNACCFEQRLLINDGYVTFSGANSTLIKLWVDVFHPVVHVEITGSSQMNLTASFETWRTAGHQMVSGEQRKNSSLFMMRYLIITKHRLEQTSWGVNTSPKLPLPYQYPDTIQYNQNGILNYHANTEQPLFDFQTNAQGLSAEAKSLYNPMLNNTVSLIFILVVAKL
jgi:hypothetical protein